MAVAELHFFAADDLNGSTIYECTTDDPWVQQIEIEPSLSHLGHGRVKFARRVGESMIASGIISAGVFVRVLIPAISTTRYVWGFFINARSQRVVDKDEKGGEYFEFGGPGPKFYLTNAILWETEYGAGAGTPDREAGVWLWSGSARPGAILNRLILEDIAHATNFLPDLTKSFSDSDDSDSVAWATDVTVGDDFTLNMGSNYLELLWVLENIGNLETDINLGTVASPLMQLDAYQTFGRDLTGAQAADTVHFTEGVNILSEMEVGGDTLLRASHALVRGAEGTWKHAIRTSWSPGDPVRAIGYDFTVSSYEPTLEAAGKRFLRVHDVDGDVDLNMQPGWAPADGLYMPGPEGTNGHFWYGDTVSLTTGLGSPSVLDYSADDKRVMAINMRLAEAVDDSDATSRAVSWLINVKFDRERTSNATAPSGTGGGNGTDSNCNCLRLCSPAVEPIAEALILESGIASVIDNQHGFAGVVVEAGQGILVFVSNKSRISAGVEWQPTGLSADDQALTKIVSLDGTAGYFECWHIANPTPSSSGTVHIDNSTDADREIFAYAVIDTDEVPAEFTEEGTSETAISTAYTATAGQRVLAWLGAWGVSVTGAATPDDLTSEEAIWTGDVPSKDGMGALASGVGGSSADWTTSGTPEYWGSIVLVFSGGSGRNLLNGTEKRAVRCDHQHHWYSTEAPTVDDDELLGFRVGTRWIQLDDLTTPTEILGTWDATDVTAGAAVWIEELGGSSTVESLTTTETDTALVLKPDGAGGVTWGTDATGGGGAGDGYGPLYDPDRPPSSGLSLSDEFDDSSLDGAWTWTTAPGGTVSESQFPGFLHIDGGTDASATTRYLRRAYAPGAVDFSVVTKCALTVDNGNFSSGIGIALLSSADAVIWSLQLVTDGTATGADGHRIIATAGGMTATGIMQGPDSFIYLLITRTSGNVYNAYVSYNGIIWIRVGGSTVATTVDKVALVYGNDTDSVHEEGIWDFIRVFGSITRKIGST